MISFGHNTNKDLDVIGFNFLQSIRCSKSNTLSFSSKLL